VLSKGRKILKAQVSPFTGKTKEETIAHLGITEAELDKLMAGYYDVVHDNNEDFCMCLTTYIDGVDVLYGGILASNAFLGESFELYFSVDSLTYSLKQTLV
jgi:hypothetical protein